MLQTSRIAPIRHHSTLRDQLHSICKRWEKLVVRDTRGRLYTIAEVSMNAVRSERLTSSRQILCSMSLYRTCRALVCVPSLFEDRRAASCKKNHPEVDFLPGQSTSVEIHTSPSRVSQKVSACRDRPELIGASSTRIVAPFPSRLPELRCLLHDTSAWEGEHSGVARAKRIMTIFPAVVPDSATFGLSY